MDKREAEESLEELFSFFTLHRWCKQTHLRIQSLTDQFTSEEKAYTTKWLKSKIESKDTVRGELTLAIIMLKLSGLSVSEVTEAVFNILIDKMNYEDFVHLSDYLFDGQSPLPGDLTYDITDRVFIDTESAIRKALPISKMISSKDSEMTVLYFTMLLCRVDLNSENKAMLFLLLYRIDARLPDCVRNGVIEHMLTIYPVLQKILEDKQGEPPLPELLNDVQEERDADTSDYTDSVSHSHADSPQRYRTEYGSEAQERHVKPADRVDELESDKPIEGKRQTSEESIDEAKSEDEVREEADRVRSSGIRSDHTERLEVRVGEEDNIEVDIHAEETERNELSKRQGYDSPGYKYAHTTENGRSGDDTQSRKSRFEIRFNRITLADLRRLLELPGRGQGTSSPEKHRLLPRVYLSIFLCCLILLPSICLVTRRYQQTDMSKHAIEHNTERIVRTENEWTFPEGATESSKNEQESSIPIQLEKKGNRIFWIVKKGDTFWRLFVFLAQQVSLEQQRTDLDEKLLVLGEDTWIGFMRVLQALNPERDLFSFIWPGDKFILVE